MTSTKSAAPLGNRLRRCIRKHAGWPGLRREQYSSGPYDSLPALLHRLSLLDVPGAARRYAGQVLPLLRQGQMAPVNAPIEKATRTLGQLVADKMDCELDNFVRRALAMGVREPSAKQHWEKFAKQLDN